MIPEITFQYYKKGSRVHKSPPGMGLLLYSLIVKAVQEIPGPVKCVKAHFVHVGIRPDKNHKRTSYHKKTNSKAFDLAKAYLEFEDGSSVLLMPKTNHAHRQLIADHWGGRALHVNDSSKHHVHLDTKGAE